MALCIEIDEIDEVTHAEMTLGIDRGDRRIVEEV